MARWARPWIVYVLLWTAITGASGVVLYQTVVRNLAVQEQAANAESGYEFSGVLTTSAREGFAARYGPKLFAFWALPLVLGSLAARGRDHMSSGIQAGLAALRAAVASRVAWAILLGFFAVLAWRFLPRYEYHVRANAPVVRVDRWTGRAEIGAFPHGVWTRIDPDPAVAPH